MKTHIAVNSWHRDDTDTPRENRKRHQETTLQRRRAKWGLRCLPRSVRCQRRPWTSEDAKKTLVTNRPASPLPHPAHFQKCGTEHKNRAINLAHDIENSVFENEQLWRCCPAGPRAPRRAATGWSIKNERYHWEGGTLSRLRNYVETYKGSLLLQLLPPPQSIFARRCSTRNICSPGVCKCMKPENSIV